MQNLKSQNGPLRVGIAGPVGAGKTTITEHLCKALREDYSLAVITNDIYTKEDGEYLMRMQALPNERIRAVETGGCPHTAIREDPSLNLAVLNALQNDFEDLDIVFIESGGDNLTAMFSPELADVTIFVIDMAMGQDIPRKRGPGLVKSDILIVNKTDLAPYVGVDFELYKEDIQTTRPNGETVFISKNDPESLEILKEKVVALL